MKKLFLLLWLLVPVGVAAYHFGPGQRMAAYDLAGGASREAAALAAAGDWGAAAEAYDLALRELPDGSVEASRSLRLGKALAQIESSGLPEAHGDLAVLLEEVEADPACDPALVAEVRSARAATQYFMTWLMRLEGEPREVWEPEIESSRQHYKLLAEQAARSGDASAEGVAREDLESAVRLARMDLKELQGLPLPSQ
jgi:hypothetical protein